MTNGRLDRLTYNSSHMSSSRRSLISEAESDVGSLLSGLSQARKIPNRRAHAHDEQSLVSEAEESLLSGLSQARKIPNRRSQDGQRARSKPKSNGIDKSPTKRERTTRDASKVKQQQHQQQHQHKNDKYKKEVQKIIQIQAFARGYIQRFAYHSQLTMEKTKNRFFAIQIQAFVRGCLQRQRYHKKHGKKRPIQSIQKVYPANHNLALSPIGLGSPKPVKKNRKSRKSKPELKPDSDSEESEVSHRLERFNQGTRLERAKTRDMVERLGESESEVGSTISNLSQARRVPDRRRKREDREKKVVLIQAFARGYIQRFLYTSMLAMQNTRRKYAAIDIQARARGYLQRKNGPQVSRKHVAPRKEPFAKTTTTTTTTTKAAKHKNGNDDSSGSRRPRRRDRNSRKDRKLDAKKKLKKPTRHHSDLEGSEALPPRELTIRKPKRHNSDSDNESDLPPRQLTITKPKRQTSDSEGSDNMPPQRLRIPTKKSGKPARAKKKGRDSPPRNLTLQMKKPRRHESDSDRSGEGSIQAEKVGVHRPERLMSLGGASDRFGESGSEVGSLMSGLSQARRVPDRRQAQDKKRKSAIKIQAIGRGYIQRFAYKSKLIMEQTKKKFFAIQIQAFVRGYLVRSRLAKSQLKKLNRNGKG